MKAVNMGLLLIENETMKWPNISVFFFIICFPISSFPAF